MPSTRCLVVMGLALLPLSAMGRTLDDVFSCPPLAPHPPATDVRYLRPSDISIVMAYGDSNMAGYAMEGIKYANRGERRGQAAAIGADTDAITIPNLLAKYNPNLTGGARGITSLTCQCHCKNITLCPEFPPSASGARSPTFSLLFEDEGSAGTDEGLFNDCTEQLCMGDGAISGAIAVVPEIMQGAVITNAPQHLLNLLLNKTTFPDIDFENDWKFLTLFVGAIDNLIACNVDPPITIDTFTETWNKTLTDLHAKFPRMVVQVVNEMELLRTVFNASSDPYCLKQYTKLENILTCCTHPGNGTNCDQVQQLAEDWNVALDALGAEWEAKNLKTFRVIMNPIIKRNPIYANEVNGFDCFHPNVLNNQNLAVNMWNNLFKDPAAKDVVINRTAVPFCPTDDSFIQ